jgi:hypothetical protein
MQFSRQGNCSTPHTHSKPVRTVAVRKQCTHKGHTWASMLRPFSNPYVPQLDVVKYYPDRTPHGGIPVPPVAQSSPAVTEVHKVRGQDHSKQVQQNSMRGTHPAGQHSTGLTLIHTATSTWNSRWQLSAIVESRFAANGTAVTQDHTVHVQKPRELDACDMPRSITASGLPRCTYMMGVLYSLMYLSSSRLLMMYRRYWLVRDLQPSQHMSQRADLVERAQNCVAEQAWG